jgi:hypothetical protein
MDPFDAAEEKQRWIDDLGVIAENFAERSLAIGRELNLAISENETFPRPSSVESQLA